MPFLWDETARWLEPFFIQGSDAYIPMPMRGKYSYSSYKARMPIYQCQCAVASHRAMRGYCLNIYLGNNFQREVQKCMFAHWYLNSNWSFDWRARLGPYYTCNFWSGPKIFCTQYFVLCRIVSCVVLIQTQTTLFSQKVIQNISLRWQKFPGNPGVYKSQSDFLFSIACRCCCNKF